jgi:type II secretory pathway pseudopilin PulG
MRPFGDKTVTRNTNRYERGFTLTELVLSMGLMTILLGGISSTILLASHALPSEQNASAAVNRGYQAADQIAGELYCARSFTEKASTAVEFTVADRSGDATPETIRYAWSGTAGDPLTRQYNGGTVVDWLADVQEFALTYDVTEVTEELPPVEAEGAETLLISHDTSVSLTDWGLTDKGWIGQYFFPPLPAEATAWKVTRVKFMARIHGGNKGITAVQLRLPTAGNLPGATILEEVLMYESALDPSYLWEEFSFASVSGLSPTQGLCLVLALNKKEAHLADVRYDDGAGSGLLTTTDAGSNWNYNSGKAMLYYVYGTVTTTSQPDPLVRQWLRSVGIKLRVGSETSSRIESAVEILNEPEVTGL